MNVTSLRVRRSLTLAGAVAALLLGFVAIGAAAAWTSTSAPLSATPVSATSVEARLRDEQARSAELEARLTTITTQTNELADALQAAQDRIVADARHADELAADLATATRRLKALEQSIRQAATTRVTTRVVSTGSSSGSGSVDHRGEPEDDEHGDDDD
jgi:septal ring factor EnvC (AmiA/AmiB activator)